MVTTGAAALDMGDDVLVGHLGGDLDDGLDLVDGARLEHHVGDADLVELLDQRDGLVELGDAGGDDDTVDGRTGLARLLHDALAAELQLPQVGVQEQRVELDGPARLQQLGQILQPVLEDLLGDLAATGQLGPVAGVGRRGDDLGVHGGRGHPGQQDRRPAGEAGELGGQFHRAVGQGDRRRRVAGPRGGHLGHGAHGEQAALARAGGGGHDADAESADDRRGQPGEGVGGAEVDDPAGARGVQRLDVGDPVDRADEDGLGHRVGEFGVDTALGGPAVDQRDTVGQARGVEADLDLDGVEDGREHRATAQLVLALGLFLLGDLRAVQLEATELFGCAGDDHRATAVADREHRRQHGAHVGREIFQQFGDPGWVDVGHRNHRRLVTAADHAAPARDQRTRGTDQLQQGEQLRVAGAFRLQRLDAKDALGMAGHGDRRGAHQVEALTGQRTDGGHLGQQDAGAGDGSGGELLGVGQRFLGGQRANPLQRFEADRADDDELPGDGLEQQRCLADEFAQLGLDAGGADQLLQALQPGAALSAECHGIRLAGIEQIDQSVRATQRTILQAVLTGRHPVVFVDRHVVFSPSVQSLSHSRLSYPCAAASRREANRSPAVRFVRWSVVCVTIQL